MPFPLDINFPSILQGQGGIFLELTSSIKLDLPDSTPAESWKKLTIIRGQGLSVDIKLSWNDRIVTNSDFIEIFGRAWSKSKLWAQLLFSISLEIPDLSANLGSIILNLSRTDTPNTTWSPSTIESQIAIHLPVAYLRKIVLIAFFTSIPRPSHNLKHPQENFCGERITPSEINELQKALDLLSLMDTAFIALLKERLEPIAPCIFRPRYLESLWHSGQHILSISNSMNHVQNITANMSLKQSIMDADTRTENMPYGLQSALWKLAKDKTCRRELPGSLFNWSQESQDFMLMLKRRFNLFSIPEKTDVVGRGVLYEERVQSDGFSIVDFDDGVLAVESRPEFEVTDIDRQLGASQPDLLWLGEGAGGDEHQLLSGAELWFLSTKVSYEDPDEMLL